MKTKLPLLLIFIALFSSLEEMNAQDFLKKIDKSNSAIKESEIYKKKNVPSKFELISLKENDFKTFLKVKSKNDKKTLQLPNTKGGFSNFVIKEVSNFETKLSEKFSNIKSYSAQGIDDPTAVAKISVGTDGFHAVVFSGKEETLYVDPYTKDNKTLIVYKRSDLEANKDDFTCQVEEYSRRSITQGKAIANTDDGKLRTFRLALVCSGEYAQFHLTNQNIESSATDEVKKAAVLSAMNTTMTRVNGVFERDLSVRMVIVGDNDSVIFLDAATDNITDGSPNTMLNQVQSICDSQIGDANYDIGHLFSIGGDGLAGGGVVCISNQKGKGVTGRGQPIGDAYDIDYVAHEMGHQFGANHTQHNDCNRAESTAVEPGSASTIMGYAGICIPNVQSKSDDYFHAVSIAEMSIIIGSTASCAVITDTSNSAPTANTGSDFSIPKSTPFLLKGIATDIDGTSSLTYNWEQIDFEILDSDLDKPDAISSVNVEGPMFRSLPSSTSPNRYMPDLETVLAGNTSTTWEVLPSVARDLNFSFLVRDNHAGGGSTARDDMTVSVTNAEAFTVSAPNSAVVWSVGATQAITWVKGTTDAAPINCQNVNIKLSIDGGVTFPIILKSNTPNDGVEDIIVPNHISASARILVEAADNIFYNVNSTNFTIFKDLLLTSTADVESACNTGNQEVNYVLNLDFADDFSETVSLSSTGQPSGSVVTFSPTTLSGDGSVTMNISNLNGITSQAYSINVAASSTNVTKNINLQLNVTDSNFSTLTLTYPVNNGIEVERGAELKWDSDVNASNYDVEIATDSGFSTIISSGNTTTNSYTFSNSSQNTTYYWRVKPKNTCGDGLFSEISNFKTISSFYCASNFTDEIGGKEHITNVTFNTINNNSGNDTVDGYENFASIETTIKRGDTHEVSVTFDTGGYQDHCFVFIDWNQDYVFDKTTERYDLGSKFDTDNDRNTTNTGTATYSITVPVEAILGTTTMRIVIEYDDGVSYGDGSCDTDHLSEYGETEDYTIIVDNTASIDDVVFEGFNLFPNPTKGEFTLNLKVINTDEVSVQLFDIRGRLIDQKKYYNTITNFSKRMSFDKASSGLYLLRVTNGNKQTTRKLIIK